MIELAPGWGLDVDRGPDWIFLRVKGSAQPAQCDLPLAETAWALMEQHFVHRIVVELEETPFLCSHLIGELVRLQRRVSNSGGLLRLSGLNQEAEESLRVTKLGALLPTFADRGAAVMGRPKQPR